jgi:hypothetical protein
VSDPRSPDRRALRRSNAWLRAVASGPLVGLRFLLDEPSSSAVSLSLANSVTVISEMKEKTIMRR